MDITRSMLERDYGIFAARAEIAHRKYYKSLAQKGPDSMTTKSLEYEYLNRRGARLVIQAQLETYFNYSPASSKHLLTTISKLSDDELRTVAEWKRESYRAS